MPRDALSSPVQAAMPDPADPASPAAFGGSVQAEAEAARVRAASPANPRRRIASGLIGAAVACGALAVDVALRQGWCLAALASVVCVAALREAFALARQRGFKPVAAVAYAALPLHFFSIELELSGVRPGWPWLECLGPWMVLAAAAAAVPFFCVKRPSSGTIAFSGLICAPAAAGWGNVAATLLGIAYLGVLPGFFLRLRHVAPAGGWGVDRSAAGMELVFAAIFVTKMCDTGALLVGKRLGRRRMCPRLSPGKTWEGAVGGLLGSLGFMALMVAASPGLALGLMGWPRALALAAWLAVWGMAGDLLESALKRFSGAKDAGRGVPGFGGVLDLVDSLMLAGPAMYAWLRFFGT